MFTQRDMFNIWMVLRKKLELVGYYDGAEWDDYLGIVNEYYDIYSFEGDITYNGKLLYFDIKTKYNENSDAHYDIEVLDIDTYNGEEHFNGWDDMNNIYQYYKIAEAFETAENNKQQK